MLGKDAHYGFLAKRFSLEPLESRQLLSGEGMVPDEVLPLAESAETEQPMPPSVEAAALAEESAEAAATEADALWAGSTLEPLEDDTPQSETNPRPTLHNVAGIPDQVNPAQARPVLLAPGRFRLDVAADSAGQAGLWKFVLPQSGDRGDRLDIEFALRGSVALPTDGAIVWFDEGGNRLGTADAAGATTFLSEDSGRLSLETGRTYLVGVFVNRGVAPDAVRLDVSVPDAVPGAAVAIDSRTGAGALSFLTLGQVFQAPTDVRWHPLNLLNAGAEAKVRALPELTGQEVTLTVYRRIPPAQQIDDGERTPAYTLIGTASSSGVTAAEVTLRAPTGSTLSEQEYVVAVSPKDYSTGTSGYRVEVAATLPLVAPATLTAAEANGSQAFALRPTVTAGLATAEFKDQATTGDAARFFSFRAAASGESVFRVEAGFDAVVALYSANRVLLGVATETVGGSVQLRANLQFGAMYYVRVANGPGRTALEGSQFRIDLEAPTPPRALSLAAPQGGAVAVEAGGFTIGASATAPPSFFELRPSVGIDVVTLGVQPISNAAVRISVASVDGSWERTYPVGQVAHLSIPITTQGAPLQIAVAASGSQGQLFYFNALTLPRELPVGTLAGRTLSPENGETEVTAAGFDRAGERVGFEFYQGLAQPNRTATWTAEGGGGALPILARYETTGSVLQLVDFQLPNDAGQAGMQFTTSSERLYAVAAYQVVREDGGTVRLKVDHPAPIPVGVGMVPDLEYEAQNQNPARFGYLLQIRNMVLERSYEQDYWETLLPDRFFAGSIAEDPAMPVLELRPDSPGGALRLKLTLLDGDGQALKRWNGDALLPFRSGSDGVIRIDFASLGVLRQNLEGKKLQFRVETDGGALGDGTYTLRMTVRTPDPGPYEITEVRWDYPGGGAIPNAVGAVSNFPSGTQIVDVLQNPSGEGSAPGLFASTAVGVHVYRFWTPSHGSFRVWTEGLGVNPANTTIQLYRARYVMTPGDESTSWWETIDYLEALDGIEPNTDWYPADRSEIDAQILIEDPEFPAYKKDTNRLGQSVQGDPPESQLTRPYLPADRQFTDVQDVYFVVVKNEQGSTGTYRLNVSTEDLPRLRTEPIYLPQRPTAQNLRSVFSIDVPGVTDYGNRIGYYEIQMPEQHSGYLGISGEAGADWRFGVFTADGTRLATATDVNGERRYLVPPDTKVVRVTVLETGSNTASNAKLTFAATLLQDAALPTNLSSLGLDGTAQTLLPTNPWGELDAGEFTGTAAVNSAGRLFRFRVPDGLTRIEVAPSEGSPVSFLWGIYEDGRLLAWDLAVPGQPATYSTTLTAKAELFDSLAGAGRNLVLVVRHASASVQPVRFDIVIDPQSDSGFGAFDPSKTSVALPALATESRATLGIANPTIVLTGGVNQNGWEPDQWVRFRVPDGPAPAATLVALPTNSSVYPLRYDVYDAAGRTLVATGTQAFANPAPEIALPQLEAGKAYLLRLAPRDQPLAENLPIQVRFNLPKAAQLNGDYVYSVPSRNPDRPVESTYAFVGFHGDFSTTASLDGRRTAWWQVEIDRAGPATLKALVSGSTRVHVAIYRDSGGGNVEFPEVDLIDFANEYDDVVTSDGKSFELETFLAAGRYFVQVSRSNSNGGDVRLDFTGPERPVERLTVDPKQGVILRSQMGRAEGTKFFEVFAPAGSYSTGTFLAYDLDLLDDRAQIERLDTTQNPPVPIISELTLRGRLQVWAVTNSLGGELSVALAKTLDREPTVGRTDPLKASVVTPGKAAPFQRYVIGIYVTGTAPGFREENSGRSKSIGVQAVFVVPNSGTPDLVVESMRLLPNSGKTLVEVTVLNRGYAVALNSQSLFKYPSLNADEPIEATVLETVLGPQGRRVRQLDWVNPTSPQDVTSYTLDVAEEVAEVDETNNADQAVMSSVNAARPSFTLDLNNGFDGNNDPGVWGRYLDSRVNNAAEVLVDIIMNAADADDAANTYDNGQEIYLLRSDSPLPYTSANHYLDTQKVIGSVAISRLAPTGPGNSNIFAAYAVDRFGLRSITEVRVIQVVPFPKWMEAGQSQVVFNPDSRQYELHFSARPVDYSATLTQMLDASVPLVGDLQNRFYVEAIADRVFTLNPNAAIAPIQPSIRARTTVLGQDILNKVFGPGTAQDHVSVLGHIDVRSDTLEAGAFELTTRFDQYPVSHWEGPEIPIFGFDAAVVSAAVQAQVIVDLKFDSALTFAFDLTQTDAPLRITSPSYVGLDLRIELRFEGEVEVAGFLDIASVGGGFFFTLKPRYGLEDMPGSIPLEDFLDEACLGLSATIGGELSADIFGFEVFSLELESDEIQLTNCDVATATSAGATALTGTTGGIPVAGAGSGVGLLSKPQALPNDSHIRYTQTVLPGDALLPTPSVRPNPQLIVDPATGERLVTYLDTPTPGAAPVLYAARGNADGFSAPVALVSTGWMSRPLLVATRDGTGLRAVVVYQVAPLPSPTTTRNQFLGGQDLRYRYFDGTSWSEEIVLTDNAQLDWQASLAFNANREGALAWVRKTANAALNAQGRLAGTEVLLVSRWDKAAHRWLAPAQVGSAGTHNQPSVAVGSDGVIGLAWNQRVQADDRIGIARRATNGTWVVSSVAEATLPGSGRPRSVALVIESDGRFTVLTAFTEALVKNLPATTRILARSGTFEELNQQSKGFTVLASTGGVSSLQAIRAPDGTLVVGWQERRGAFSDAVVVRRQADGTWSRPERVTQSAGNERALRLVVDNSGAVLSIYEHGVHYFSGTGGTLVPADGPDLKLPTTVAGLIGSTFAIRGPELNVVGPLFLAGLPGDQRPSALAGTTIDASVQIQNTGGTTGEAVVTFYRENPLGVGGRGDKVGERKVRLLPGGSLVVTVPVDIGLGVNQFTAEVTLASGRDAFSSQDNSVTGQVTGRIDLAVEAVSIAAQVAGQSPQVGRPIGVRYELVNRAGVAYRGPVRVTTFWEDPAKPGVRTTVQSGLGTIDLAPGQRQALAGLVTFAQPGLRLIGVEISEINGTELTTANNQDVVPLDLRPDLALRPVQEVIRGDITITRPALDVRVINFTGVANAVLAVAVSNTGSAPVRSFTLRIEHAVDDAPFTVLLTNSVTLPIQPGDHRIVEFKVPALAGVNTYRAEVTVAVEDLPAGLPERVRADNVARTSVVVQGLPDLVVGAATFNTPNSPAPTLRPGALARLDVRVDNQGIAAAEGVRVEVFAVSRGQLGEGLLIGTATLASVPALGSASARITLDTNQLPESANSIRVVIDRHQDILERSDLNNTASRPILVAPPVLLASQGYLNAGTGQWSRVGSLSVTFNQIIAVPANPGILRFENLTTGEIIDTSKFTLSLNAATRTLTWTFASLPGGVLPAGQYAARLAPGALADRLSNPLGREFVLHFTVTPGDANGDGVTNERDYLLVWRELRKAEATRNLALDVDGDGKVTTADLDLVRGNFGRRGTIGTGQP